MNLAPSLLSVRDLTLQFNGQVILDNIELELRAGEQWAIIGASGSGKTMLAHALAGRNFHTGKIAYHFPGREKQQQDVLLVEQQHHFKNLSNTNTFYYQQRFNSMDAEDSQTVQEYMHPAIAANPAEAALLLKPLHLDSFLNKPLIQLSNGENKRLQLIIALLQKPAMLILDNPFTGLDSGGRKVLHGIIDSIIDSGIHIILITNAQELPASITHIAVLEKGRLQYKGIKENYQQAAGTAASEEFDITHFKRIIPTPHKRFETAVRMKNVTVKYGDKIIFSQLDWEVKRGECWNITGPNGAGKSTLLSLINGDNPQAYANEIYLFDRRRGSGESIWDIKSRIGYVSPELHLFFDQSNSSVEVIASGLFDTIGLFRQLSEAQREQVNNVQELFRLKPISQKPLFQLSLGQQRLVLLARALVKHPPLLILDEPCQGLDEQQAQSIKKLIDEVCRHTDTTLLYVSHYEKDVPACVDKYLRLGTGGYSIEKAG